MSHIFRLPDDIYSEIASYAAQHGQTPDALLITLVKEGVEQLKHTDKMAAIRKGNYDPAHDPLAPFIGSVDSGEEDSGWIERHDEYFGGSERGGERYGNTK
jgi:hypothetical protein